MSSAPLPHQHISDTSATDGSIALAGQFPNLTNVAIGTRKCWCIKLVCSLQRPEAKMISSKPPSETLLHRSFSTRSRLCRPRRPPLASRQMMLTTSRLRSAYQLRWRRKVSTCYRTCLPHPRAVTGYMSFLGTREQRSPIRAGLSRYYKRDQNWRIRRLIYSN